MKLDARVAQRREAASVADEVEVEAVRDDVAGGRRCGNRVLVAPGEGGASACGRMLTMARATAAC